MLVTFRCLTQAFLIAGVHIGTMM